MEHAQRVPNSDDWSEDKMVLILILMEHAQRAYKIVAAYILFYFVLILILMEHAQRDLTKAKLTTLEKS